MQIAHAAYAAEQFRKYLKEINNGGIRR